MKAKRSGRNIWRKRQPFGQQMKNTGGKGGVFMEPYWRWFMYQTKILPEQREKCLEYFGTPENMFIAPREKVEKAEFLSEPARAALLVSRTEEELQREEKEMTEKGIVFYSREHEAYPARLKEIHHPPCGLFVRGRLPHFEKEKKEVQAAAVVGARWASHAGLSLAKETAGALAEEGIPVISGMASGIDGAAQEAALMAGGESYAVLGCGPDICYPRHNAGLYRMLENKGGLLSEYPPGTPPVAWHFPYRNRIISGLSDAVLVVEARLKSGSLITADYALEQGKDVYAVPGRIEDPLSQGCNRLISQGAGVFCSLEGFLSELGLTNRNYENFRKNDLTLEKTESMVYSCVDFRGKSLEAIRMETGLSREAVLTALLSLELMDLIEEKTRYYYRK
ncbi:DNA-protecting protein DprA [Blautia sp. OF03-15BH]|nr:DNA-protecting protein DprA [Blautia sp. OF03-15BH]